MHGSRQLAAAPAAFKAYILSLWMAGRSLARAPAHLTPPTERASTLARTRIRMYDRALDKVVKFQVAFGEGVDVVLFDTHRQHAAAVRRERPLGKPLPRCRIPNDKVVPAPEGKGRPPGLARRRRGSRPPQAIRIGRCETGTTEATPTDRRFPTLHQLSKSADIILHLEPPHGLLVGHREKRPIQGPLSGDTRKG